MQVRSVWKLYISFLNGDNKTFSGTQDFVRSSLVQNINEALCGAVWCRELNGRERFINMKQVFRSEDCRYIFSRHADGSLKWRKCGD